MTRLREVVLEVGDVVAATAFYAGLGLAVRKTGAWEEGAYAELSDDAGLALMLVEGTAGARVTFTVADAGAALETARGAGATIERPAAAGGGGSWATARDPWGNPLGFWSRA